MSRIRTLILSPALTAASGVATHANQLFNSSLSARFELRHFQVGSEGRRESLAGAAARLLLSPIQLAFTILRDRPAIVHLNTSITFRGFWRDLTYLIITKLLRRKAIVQVHGGVMPQHFFKRGGLRTFVLRRFFESSDAVVVLSKEQQHAYAAFSPAINVVFIPNAIDTTGLTCPIAERRRDLPLRLVFVGRLSHEKGLFEAIAAMAALRDQQRSFSFSIAGGGEAFEDLKHSVKQLGLERSVHFIGPIFGEMKAQLWCDSDVFVFPSYTEGLPYSLLEAMAAGTPAITCAVGAIPDVMQDGVHGLLVPVRDVQAVAAAIVRLDEDRNLLCRMALAGRERVFERYTAARLTEDFGRLYSQLAARP